MRQQICMASKTSQCWCWCHLMPFGPIFSTLISIAECWHVWPLTQESGVWFHLLPSLFSVKSPKMWLKMWDMRASKYWAHKLPLKWDMGQTEAASFGQCVNHLWRCLLVDVETGGLPAKKVRLNYKHPSCKEACLKFAALGSWWSEGRALVPFKLVV